MYKFFLGCFAIGLFSSQGFASEWILGERAYADEVGPKASLKSDDGENEIYIFRKTPKSSASSGHSKDMVYLGFKTNSIDQINRRGAVIYKASKGKPLSLGSNSKIAGFDNKIETVSFHGKPSSNCGIISNILNSEKLTVRYFTTGQNTRDVDFNLPSNNEVVFKLLGFEKGKDCSEIFE